MAKITAAILTLFMVCHGASSQISLTPRLSYNWANYRAFDCFQTACPNSRSNLGLGLNASRNVYKELSIVSGINFYTNKVDYQQETSVNPGIQNYQFRHFDFKLGVENKIFGNKTAIGIGLQMEVMYDIMDLDFRSGEFIEYPNASYFGFELTTSHKIGKLEFFFDSFFNINSITRGRVSFLYHTTFQFGLGYPLSFGISKNEK